MHDGKKNADNSAFYSTNGAEEGTNDYSYEVSYKAIIKRY